MTTTHHVWPIERHMSELLAAIPGSRRGNGPGHGFPDDVEVPTIDPRVRVVVQDLGPWNEDEAGGSGAYVVATVRDDDGVMAVLAETFVPEDQARPRDVAEVVEAHVNVYTEERLRDAAIHDGTGRDDVVIWEVRNGRPFPRELRELIPDTDGVVPVHDLAPAAVVVAVQRITGAAVPAQMNRSQARAQLRRWGVLTVGSLR